MNNCHKMVKPQRKRQCRRQHHFLAAVASSLAYGSCGVQAMWSLRDSCTNSADLIQRVKAHCTKSIGSHETHKLDAPFRSFTKTLHKKSYRKTEVKKVLDGIQSDIEEFYTIENLPRLGQSAVSRQLRCYRAMQERFIDEVYSTDARFGDFNMEEKANYAEKNVKAVMSLTDLTQATCPVSFETLSDTSAIRITDCKHFFQKDILVKCFQSKRSCPVCRNEVRTFCDLQKHSYYSLPEIVRWVAGTEHSATQVLSFVLAVRHARANREDISEETLSTLESAQETTLYMLGHTSLAVQQILPYLPQVTVRSAREWQDTWKKVIALTKPSDQVRQQAFKQLLERLLPEMATDIAEADRSAAVKEVLRTINESPDSIAGTCARQILQERGHDQQGIAADELAHDFARHAMNGQQVPSDELCERLRNSPEQYQQAFWQVFFPYYEQAHIQQSSQPYQEFIAIAYRYSIFRPTIDSFMKEWTQRHQEQQQKQQAAAASSAILRPIQQPATQNKQQQQESNVLRGATKKEDGWYITADGLMIYWYEEDTAAHGSNSPVLTKYYKCDEVNAFLAIYEHRLYSMPQENPAQDAIVFVTNGTQSQWMSKDYFDFQDSYNPSGGAVRSYTHHTNKPPVQLRQLPTGMHPHYDEQDYRRVDFFYTQEERFRSRPSKWKYSSQGYVFDDSVFAQETSPNQLHVYYKYDEITSALERNGYEWRQLPSGAYVVAFKDARESTWDIPDDLKSSLMPITV